MEGQQQQNQNDGGGDAAAAAAASAAAAAAAANQGAAPAPWFTDQQKPFVEAKGWKSPADVLTSYQNLESLVGADKAGRTIIKPKDANDAEGIKAFNLALGVPKDVAGYKMPDAYKDDPTIKGFAELALKAGMPAAQFDAVMEWTANMAKEQQTALNAEVARVTTADLDKLKAEWGNTFDQKAEFAKRFLRESGWDDKKIERYEQTFGTAVMLKDFYQWGSKTGEPNFAGGDSGGGFSATKQAVQKEIDTLRLARMNNQVSDSEYNAKMAQLGPKLEAA